MRRLPPSRGAFRRARPAPKLFRAPSWRSVLAGRPGQTPHVFIEVRGPRLDPCSYALRVRLQGRVRSHDFCNRCFREHDHGPLRTSRAAGNRRRDDCPFRRKSPFGLAAAKASWGRGPRLTAPRRSPPELLPAETLPRPRSLRAPPVARTVPHPCPERRGRRAEPPAQRTLARCTLREGRAAPHLREEARRSPTRGAFHRQAARDTDGSAATTRQAGLHRMAAPFSPSTDPGEGRSLGP